jgi:hypothetical protein
MSHPTKRNLEEYTDNDDSHNNKKMKQGEDSRLVQIVKNFLSDGRFFAPVCSSHGGSIDWNRHASYFESWEIMFGDLLHANLQNDQDHVICYFMIQVALGNESANCELMVLLDQYIDEIAYIGEEELKQIWGNIMKTYSEFDNVDIFSVFNSWITISNHIEHGLPFLSHNLDRLLVKSLYNIEKTIPQQSIPRCHVAVKRKQNNADLQSMICSETMSID